MVNVAAELYESLLAASRKALDNQQYEVAFHALSATFHCAEAFGDEQHFLTVQQEAQRQIEFIDAHNPEHRLSTHSHILGKGRSLYHSLIIQSRARIKQLDFKRRRQARQERLESLSSIMELSHPSHPAQKF